MGGYSLCPVCVCGCFVVVNVYAGTMNRRTRLVFAAYTVVVRSVYNGCLHCVLWLIYLLCAVFGDVCVQLFVHICFLFLL